VTSVIIQPADIWTAAGVLLGFQVTSFIWRIDREVKIRDEETGQHQGGPWLTPSDFVNIISMIVVVVGVFVLPILGLANLTFLKDSFGLAALLFIGHAFARAGHYSLYMYPLKALRDRLRKILGKKDVTSDQSAVPRLIYPPQYYPRQERVVVTIIIMLVIAYIITYRSRKFGCNPKILIH